MTASRIDLGMAAAAARELPADVTPELRTRYRQLRVMLHTAGLAATYAYIAAKARDTDQVQDNLAAAYRVAGEVIRKRLWERNMLPGAEEPVAPRQVLASLGAMNQVQYARASAEAAALVDWMARLADAMYAPKRANTTTPDDANA